ncbi:MAG: hypothetical protein ACI9RO_001826 [Alteromonas macleodii]|jgi:hypothetical protein
MIKFMKGVNSQLILLIALGEALIVLLLLGIRKN